MRKSKKIWYYYLPPLVLMVLIFVLSGIPNLKIDDSNSEFFRRKIVHMFEFGLLWLLIYRAVFKEKWLATMKESWQKLALSVFGTIAYAASDEIHQLFVATRDGKLSDLFFDILGIVITMSFFNLHLEIRKKKNKMPLWPISLGIFVLAAIIYLSYFYYQSYCSAF